MVVAALIIAKALFEILLVGTKTETVPGESNVVFISSINIGLFLSNKPARKHSARRLQVKKLGIVFSVLKFFKIPKGLRKSPPFMVFDFPADYLAQTS